MGRIRKVIKGGGASRLLSLTEWIPSDWEYVEVYDLAELVPVELLKERLTARLGTPDIIVLVVAKLPVPKKE